MEDKMRNKKIIAFTLCIGILASSFGSYITGYSQINTNKFTEKKYDTSLDNSGINTLPSLNLAEIEPEVNNRKNIYSNNSLITSDNNEEILYKGTKSTLNPGTPDIYNISEDEVKSMLQEGYTVKDIFEADKIGNETGIEPKTLLEKKESTGKSLNQIKNEILETNRKKVVEEFKKTYPKEYEKLKSKKVKESDITNLIVYAEINNRKITDDLVTAYLKSGSKLFEKPIVTENEDQISQDDKKKYQLSDLETESIPAELIPKFEELAKKTGKPVKELMKGYLKGNSSGE